MEELVECFGQTKAVQHSRDWKLLVTWLQCFRCERDSRQVRPLVFSCMSAAYL